MNKKYILGGFVVVVFIGMMILLLTQGGLQYEDDLSKVMAKSKTIKAAGKWMKEKSIEMNTQEKVCFFTMSDNLGNQMKVKYKGVLPDNFSTAQSIVVTGKFQNGLFNATDILTKCPSKYQEQSKKQSNT